MSAVQALDGLVQSKTFQESQADTAAQVLAGQSDAPVDPAGYARVLKKIDWHLLPLMCSECDSGLIDVRTLRWIYGLAMYWIQFMDKSTLGNASIMGIK